MYPEVLEQFGELTERQEEVSVRDLFTEQPLVPGSAAGLGVEPGIPASPVPPGTRRPCSATAAGSQSGKHVPRRGREDVCRAPRAQSGEPACVPASRRAAASRPPSGDVTSSIFPSRGLSGTEAPGRPPAQPVPARSPPARACCPASQVPRGGAARGAVGPGADACEGAGPWATSSSQGATRQGPEPGQDRARVGPQRPAICQPAPTPGSPEGGLRTSLGTPASPGTAPQRWPARGWICGGRGAGGPGGARVSRQSPARPCWSSSNTGPRGASPAPIPPAPSRSPVPRGRGAAEPAERQIRGGRDGCRGAPGGQRGPGHSGGRGDGGRPLAAEGAALHGKVGVTGTLSRPRRGTPRPVPGSQLPGPRPFRPMPTAPASCPAGGKCARAGARPSEAECVRACAQVWLCAAEADQSQCCEETQCLTRERTAQCLGTFV